MPEALQVDHFATFGLAPRPWLDPDALKEHFLRLSTDLHPDKQVDAADKTVAEERFAQLNESYNVLRQPRSRILHLLALNGFPSQPHIQSVPAGLDEFFGPIAEQTRAADELVRKRAAAASPMLKVQLFEQGLELTDALQSLQQRLAERQRGAEDEIRLADSEWSVSECELVLRRLQSAAARLGFLERWQAQVQQRVAALAF